MYRTGRYVRLGRGSSTAAAALDTLFLAALVANKGSLTQCVGRILRSHEKKAMAEVRDYFLDRAPDRPVS